MKLGIMQPYFMPYIGYWQLMNAVDKYIIYDDVNYKKGSWVNRNRILMSGKPEGWGYLNLNLDHASPNKKFNEISVLRDEHFIKKQLRGIIGSYQKAPFFNEVFPLLEDIFTQKESQLAKYLKHSFEVVNKYIGIKTELIMSSDIVKNNDLKLEKKVIHICELMKADKYYSAMGGWDLYSKDEFAEHGIEFIFLKAKDSIKYKQFNNEFVPALSIIDVMMFNSVPEIQKMLDEYELL